MCTVLVILAIDSGYPAIYERPSYNIGNLSVLDNNHSTKYNIFGVMTQKTRRLCWSNMWVVECKMQKKKDSHLISILLLLHLLMVATISFNEYFDLFIINFKNKLNEMNDNESKLSYVFHFD